MQTLFNLLSATVSLYTTICFVRIIFTWIPQLNYSAIGQFLSAICDPWLNLFSRIPLRIGGLDFTPMLSIGVLTLISSLLKNIAATGRIYVGGILANLVSLVWAVFSSIALILFITLLVRLLVMVFSKKSNYYNSPWIRFDNALNPLVFKLSRPFSRGKNISYKTALIISTIMLCVLLVLGQILTAKIIELIILLPF